jgi:hypothetical protein
LKTRKKLFKKKWFGANWWEGCQIPIHPKNIVQKKNPRKNPRKNIIGHWSVIM